MRKKLLFLCSLLSISLVLFLLQDLLAMGYQLLLLPLCSMLLPEGQNLVSLDYDSSFRTIPFLSLMIATPKIAFKKRGIVILLGIAIFISIDVASIVIWGDTPTNKSTFAHLFFSHMWKTFGQWILPFLMWFMAVHKDLPALFAQDNKEDAFQKP